jgi:FlaG/FlaF family flagellin (archaellin)
MEQMVAHWEAIPPTSEFIYLRKLSGTDARINTVLRRVDPSLTASGGENLTDLACVIPFYWEVGDTVQITYANTDDQEVGVEIMLVEVE